MKSQIYQADVRLYDVFKATGELRKSILVLNDRQSQKNREAIKLAKSIGAQCAMGSGGMVNGFRFETRPDKNVWTGDHRCWYPKKRPPEAKQIREEMGRINGIVNLEREFAAAVNSEPLLVSIDGLMIVNPNYQIVGDALWVFIPKSKDRKYEPPKGLKPVKASTYVAAVEAANARKSKEKP